MNTPLLRRFREEKSLCVLSSPKHDYSRDLAAATAPVVVLGTLALGLLFGPAAAQATPLYWDANGTTAGAGGTPTGTWGTSNFWNSDSAGAAGGSFTTTTTSADTLFFVAGPSATSGNTNFTVSISGTQSANSITLQSSANMITLGADSSSTINLTGGITMASQAYTGVNAGGATFNSKIALQGSQTFTTPRAPGLTFNGEISGTGNLVLSGNGVKNFNAANTYAGTTTVNNTGALILGGTAGSIGTGNLILNTGTQVQFVQTSDITFSNNITGASGSSSALTKNSLSTLTLAGNNTYTGGTVIRSGAISVASINTNLGSGIIGLGVSTDTGTLIYTGGGETVTKTIRLGGTTGGGRIQADGTGALIITGGIDTSTNGVKILTLQGSSVANNEIQGAIENSANGNATSLTKSGVGKWILSGTNTYTGATNIGNGTLLINGDNSAATGAVTVSSGAVLGGSGTIGAATSANSGSFLSAGNDSTPAGTLTFGSTLNISGLTAGTGGLLFDLGATGASDKLVLSSGALTIGSGVLNFDDFAFNTLGGFDAGTYTLIDTSTSIVGTLGTSLSGVVGGLEGVLSISGNDIVLTVYAIPEPSTYAALAGVLALGGAVIRKRRHGAEPLK